MGGNPLKQAGISCSLNCAVDQWPQAMITPDTVTRDSISLLPTDLMLWHYTECTHSRVSRTELSSEANLHRGATVGPHSSVED